MTISVVQEIVGAIVGAVAGVAVMGVANHFTFNRSVWPIPVCAHCGATAPFTAYVPFISGSQPCSICGKPAGWLLSTAVQIVSAILTVLLLRQYGVGAILFSAVLETYVLLAVAVTDMQHRLIPTLLVYPAVVFALATSAAWPNLGVVNSLLGAGIAFALFFALAFIARVVFGDGALGDGDVTLAALVGAICGYPMVVFSLALGALAGGIGALLVLLVRRSAFGTTIPYGPYLVIGVLYVLLSGNTTHPLYTVL